MSDLHTPFSNVDRKVMSVLRLLWKEGFEATATSIPKPGHDTAATESFDILIRKEFGSEGIKEFKVNLRLIYIEITSEDEIFKFILNRIRKGILRGEWVSINDND